MQEASRRYRVDAFPTKCFGTFPLAELRDTPLQSVLLVPEPILRFIGHNRPNR